MICHEILVANHVAKSGHTIVKQFTETVEFKKLHRVILYLIFLSQGYTEGFRRF